MLDGPLPRSAAAAARPQAAAPWIEQTVRARLLRLAILLLLPSISLAAMVTWRSFNADQAAAESDLRDAARGVGATVTAELRRTGLVLQMLAASDALAQRDMPGFVNLARAAGLADTRIVLRNHVGSTLADTDDDPDRAAAPLADWDQPVSRTTTVQWAQPGAARALLLTVPANLYGTHAYNVTAVIAPLVLRQLVQSAPLPPGWLAGLYDNRQVVAAGSDPGDGAEGHAAPPDIAEPLRRGADTVQSGRTADGRTMLFAVTRLSDAGISVAVLAPRDRIAQPSHLSLMLLLGEGGALIIAGLLGALSVANSISGPIEALAGAARRLGDTSDLPLIPAGLAEADEVARAMRAANQVMIERRQALSHINATLAARVAARTAELADVNRALEEQRAQLGLILDHMPMGVLVNRADGEQLYANPEARRLLGLDRSHIEAGTPPALLRRGGVILPPHECPPARARAGIQTERELLTMERPDGRLLDLEVSAGPIRDGQGRVVLAVTTMQDVAERLEAEEIRRRSQRLEAVGQLTGGVAHEFNNLLMAIGGCLDLLAPHIRGERARLMLENALRATDRGASLTRQLLAFARRQHLNAEPVDLNALVSGLTELLASTLGRSVQIVANLAAGAWPAMADAPQLELVLLNLAINARDAMPGGGRLVIGTANTMLGPPRRAELPPEGEYATLIVTDTGTGMQADVLARAFEPFFTTKDVGRGSGLGLAQVLGVAQELGGGVGIDSAPGEGTTVSVFLPRAAATPVGRRPPPVPTADWAQRRALSGTRLLLVDDDLAVREIAHVMLEEMGATVIDATNGHDALLQLRTEAAIDIVLVDYTMPQMTGVDLSIQISRILPNVAVVLMTGYSAAAIGDAGPHIKAVLQKPFRAEALAETLVRVLGLEGGIDQRRG